MRKQDSAEPDSLGIHSVDVGSGLPVVFMHGIGGDHHQLLEFGEATLGDIAGLRRIYVDLPGHGLSRGDGIGCAADVHRRMAGFVDRLGPRYALVGSSFGGGTARAVLALDPGRVAGMALFAPVVFAQRVDRVLPAKGRRPADPRWVLDLEPKHVVAEFRAVTHRPTSENWEAFRRDIVPGSISGDRAAITRVMDNYDFATRPEAAFGSFERPVLFVLGREDPMVGWRDAIGLADSYPRATYAVVEAGHNPFHEQREIAAASLRSWAHTVVAEEETVERIGGVGPRVE